MLLLGIDLGTSSIKVSIVNAATQQCIASAQYPETETPILSSQPGWAEQSPIDWWQHVKQAILKVHATKKYNPKDIKAIGIAYQMHGLVCLNKENKVIRNSIIWCDSRAVDLGNEAFKTIGEEKCLSHLLNSPGNFTASKLAWVKQHEPSLYAQIDKIMLPGDFIALQLTGHLTTTVAALSEGVFWDFKQQSLSNDVFRYYQINKDFIPPIQPVFSNHGNISNDIATELSLTAGITVSYKAGDQPNNALSLNVLEPGEVAATAGTSGVIYAVSNQLAYDKQSRVNTFAHVNHTLPSSQGRLESEIRLGVLLCVNGCGIMNRYVKDNFSNGLSYTQMNEQASNIAIGSNGLNVLPFGNGAERMLNNKSKGAFIQSMDLNIHTSAHLFRATQEGIACALRYGLEIMRGNGIQPAVIRAGYANMFLSDVFTETFVNITGIPVELYKNDGSVGAALGAGIGAKIFGNATEAFAGAKKWKTIEPLTNNNAYQQLYQSWKKKLERQMLTEE
jgi:xylulokinase